MCLVHYGAEKKRSENARFVASEARRKKQRRDWIVGVSSFAVVLILAIAFASAGGTGSEDEGTGSEANNAASPSAKATYQDFLDAFDANRSCAELIEIRNDMPQLGGDISAVNKALHSVRCFTSADERQAPTATTTSGSTDKPRATSVSSNPVSRMTALEQMEIAFVGGYSASQIKSRIEHAMDLYGLPITEDNRSRAGSVLVALRKEFGPAEMDILDYMIRSHVDGVAVSFADMAGISVVFLATGD
jgi:hypothetical protein